MTPSSAAEAITNAGDYIFRNHSRDSMNSEVLAPMAIKKYKNIAIFFDKGNDALLINAESFKKVFTSLGGEVSGYFPVLSNQGDYRTELTKIKAKIDKVDAIYLLLFLNDGATILKQMNELGIKKPLLGNKIFATDEFIRLVGKDNAEGMIYTDVNYSRDMNPAFWDLYHEKTGRIPTVWAPQAYDATKVLWSTAESCRGKTTACIKDSLYNLKNYTGAGGKIEFDQNGDAKKEVIIKQIKNGEFVPYVE